MHATRPGLFYLHIISMDYVEQKEGNSQEDSKASKA